VLALPEPAVFDPVPAGGHVTPGACPAVGAVVEGPLAIGIAAGLQPLPGAVALCVADRRQQGYQSGVERVAGPLEILQRAESEFDPVPFDAEAAPIYGRVTAAVIAGGRKPRRRTAGLMIAATAIAEDLPLSTANPADFVGLDALLRIIPVTRPDVPHEQARSC
jgi:predicted nucleic acid-binding protein